MPHYPSSTDDVCCSICGLASSVIAAFEEDVYIATVPDLNRKQRRRVEHLLRPQALPSAESWCPIDQAAQQNFHANLALIGRLDKSRRSIVHQETLDRVKDRHRDLERSPIGLLCGLTSDLWTSDVLRPSLRSIHLVDGHATDTIDLESSMASGKRSPSRKKYSIERRKGAFLVHVPCWELLQGAVQWRSQHLKPTPAITPESFWWTRVTASSPHPRYRRPDIQYPRLEWETRADAEAKALAALNRKILPCEKWLRDSVVPELHLDHVRRTRNFSISERDRLARAVKDGIHQCLIGEAMKSNVRQELWLQMKAWAWQPPYRFELSSGFVMERRTEDGMASSTKVVLPRELWDAIISLLNIRDAVALNGTCRHIQWQTQPSLEVVVKELIEQTRPWMLPHTPREKTEWEKEMSDGQKASGREFSWVAYATGSSENPLSPLHNRKRIWKLTEEIIARSLLVVDDRLDSD